MNAENKETGQGRSLRKRAGAPRKGDGGATAVGREDNEGRQSQRRNLVSV